MSRNLKLPHSSQPLPSLIELGRLKVFSAHFLHTLGGLKFPNRLKLLRLQKKKKEKELKLSSDITVCCAGGPRRLYGECTELPILSPPFHPHCAWAAPKVAPALAGPRLWIWGASEFTAHPSAGLYLFSTTLVTLWQGRQSGTVCWCAVLPCGSPQSVWVHSGFKGLFKLLQINIAWQRKQNMLQGGLPR